MRTVDHIVTLNRENSGGLVTYGTRGVLGIELLDPFISLNQHGPQTFPPNNHGLPFAPHPHRGFETLTLIFEGDVRHRDTTGGDSVIGPGGIQWMTAGRGIIHEEISSDQFMRDGGVLDIIQIWMNLPAAQKAIPAAYYGLQKPDIPAVAQDGGKVSLNLFSGAWNGISGPVPSPTGLFMVSLDMAAGGTWRTEVPEARTILCYVAAGAVRINGHDAPAHSLAIFARDGTEVAIEAGEDAIVVFGHGTPYGERIVGYGPFVMNSEDEIRQAIVDYQSGRFL